MCSGSLDVAPIDDGLEDDFEEPPHIVNTKIHVTTLDVIVSVSLETQLKNIAVNAEW